MRQRQIRTILWENNKNHSIEYFNLFVLGESFVLEGTVILLLDRWPTRITYSAKCDRDWRTRAAVIHQERSGDIKQLTLKVGEDQIWYTDESIVPYAAGVYDVDLEITPSTNMLPIRRIDLKVGESQEIDAVWVRFPSLTLERLYQRYTRIDHKLYKYENPLTGYEAELIVDELGAVVYYDDLWHQVSA